MPFYKFGPNDIIYNRVKAHPRCNFFFYRNETLYNNKPPTVGRFTTNNINDVMTGSISLYELNVDRVSGGIDYHNKPDIIYPFIYKSGMLMDFKTVSYASVDQTLLEEFDSTDYGDVLTGSYSISASIVKEYLPLNHWQTSTFEISGIFSDQPEERDQVEIQHAQNAVGSKIGALKNVLDYYKIYSKHYAYSSSGNGLEWDKSNQEMGLLSIPSIFFGSSIKRGTVNLKFYITGTVVGELKDERNNGELIQTGPAGSTGSGSIAGVVLYNEGFILLTGSWDLSNGPAHTERYLGVAASAPRWIEFAQTIATGTAETAYHSSWELNFSGTNYVPTVTMLAHAKKGNLNFSSNPTFVKYGQHLVDRVLTGSNKRYKEYDQIEIKNTVSSSYLDPTGSFKNTTYVSKIGIYDKDKNLIGIAKSATPIKKTEERELTFKLKLDF